MHMKLERSLEYLAPHHAGILAAAAMGGVDIEPVVGGATRLVGYGATKYGYGACCVLDIISTPYVMEPHIIWLPWITSAHKIVHFKWAVELMSRTHQVLLNVEKKHRAFFDHFAKKGTLRKIGYIENLPEVGEIHMYQVQRTLA